MSPFMTLPAAAVAEAAHAVNNRLLESIRILTAARSVDFSRRQQFRVLRVEQFVCLQRGRKLQ